LGSELILVSWQSPLGSLHGVKTDNKHAVPKDTLSTVCGAYHQMMVVVQVTGASTEESTF